MARSQRGDGGGEHGSEPDKGQPQMLSNGPIPEVDESQMRSAPIEAGDATLVGKGKPSPKMKKYRVTSQDKYVRSHGQRSLLRFGKIVSEQQYDIKELKAQGIELDELSEEEAG